MTDVGMNLTGVTYYGTDYPFLDRMKTSSLWTAQGAAVTVNANGYPTALPTGHNSVQTEVALDPASAGTSHFYVLTYNGNAIVSLEGAKIVSQSAGQVVFEYTANADTPQAQLSFMYDATHNVLPTQISLVRQDQVALFNSGEIFNPAFVAKLSSFSDLRFMDWGNTNGSAVVNWSDRTTTSDLSWAANSKTSSVPLEVMVALANETGKDMWYNVPAQASDDFVKQTLTYIRDNLKSGITLHLEYSNEVWNSSFAQNQYAASMATSLWGTVSDPAEQYYGYRSAQIASMAKTIFGNSAATRVDAVIATQTAYAGRENNIFAGVARANVGSVSDLFKEYAVTTYFGGEMSGNTAADRATVLSWAQSGAAGMDKAFAELTTGGLLSGNQSMKTILGWLTYQEGVASANGLSMVAYEGGIDLTAFHYDTAQQPIILDFFKRLLADPRMGDLYQQMASGFSAAGGDELTAFNEVGKTSVWGSYGALDNIYQDSSVRFDALVAAAKAGAAAPAAVPAGPIQERGTSGNDALGATAAQVSQMSGGSGNDIYYVDSSDDTVTELANAGTDEVRTTLATYTLGANVENLRYTGSVQFTGTGNDLANVITGGDGGASLYGGAGNDTLNGGAGNDILDGGTGADILQGGGGNDTYYVDNVGDRVVEAAGAGTDQVYSSVSYTLDPNIENLTLTGSANLNATGNALANVLVGNSGNNVLDGGAGADTMSGGAGNDTYYVDNVGDHVIEAVNGGTDTIVSSVNYSLAGLEVENLTLSGSANLNATGNAYANTLAGNAGNNVLDGGAGADRMIGGAGDDSYYVDSSGDQVIELAGGGTDSVYTTLTNYNLVANVENLSYTGSVASTMVGNDLDNVIHGSNFGGALYGGAGNDTLYGGDGADSLSGGTGHDIMIGGKGDDTYSVDDVNDVVVEGVGGGTDRVNTSVSYQLSANVEQLFAGGTAAISLTGNDLDNQLSGNDAANVISGGAGKDYIWGNGGNDTIDGGADADQLFGGDGNDIIYGGSGDDVIYGQNGNDTIVGGAGNDYMSGGAGADRFVFGIGDLSNTFSAVDRIIDFSTQEGDKIDLAAIDASSLAAGDQAFSFIGAANFTKQAGQLRAYQGNGCWNVAMDTNGDGIADLCLTVVSKTNLVASDFVL